MVVVLVLDDVPTEFLRCDTIRECLIRRFLFLAILSLAQTYKIINRIIITIGWKINPKTELIA